jgi:hypothetical protein
MITLEQLRKGSPIVVSFRQSAAQAGIQPTLAATPSFHEPSLTLGRMIRCLTSNVHSRGSQQIHPNSTTCQTPT